MLLDQITMQTRRNDVVGIVDNVSSQISELERLLQKSTVEEDRIQDKIDTLKEYLHFHDADGGYYNELEDGHLMVVFDGVSLGNGRLAAEKIKDYMQEHGTEIVDESSLLEAVVELNTILFENGACSTFVVAIVKGDEVAVYNMGDSGAYLVRDGEVKDIRHPLIGRVYIELSGVKNNFLGIKSTKGLNLNVESYSGAVGKSVSSLQDGDLIVLSSDGYHDRGYEDGSVIKFMQRIFNSNADRYAAAKRGDKLNMMVSDIGKAATYAVNNDDRVILMTDVRLS